MIAATGRSFPFKTINWHSSQGAHSSVCSDLSAAGPPRSVSVMHSSPGLGLYAGRLFTGGLGQLAGSDQQELMHDCL